MKKYLLISIPFLFAVSTFFASVVIDFFGVATCQECFEAEMLLESLKYEIDDDVVLNKFMLTEAKNQELKLKYARVYDIPENQYDLYPLIFIGKDAFYPANMNPDEILTSMQNYSQEEREAKLKEIEELEEDVSQRLKDRYEQFSVMVVLGAGLIDGINPCAFVVLIFLVSYLRWQRQGKLITVYSSLLGSWRISSIGTGLLGAVGYLRSRRSSCVYPAMAVFTGILAVLSILDFYRMHYKGKKAVLELSAGLKKKTHDIIRKNARAKTIWIASLVTGVLVSFVEFMCTGQVYLPTIVYVINSAGVSADALGFLVIYNLGFTVPVIAITLIAYFSSSTKKIQEYMTSTNAAAKIKLIMGALFTVFFIIMLNITFRTFNVIK